MAIQVNQSNIIKQLTNQRTIDSSKFSPTLGTNVKIINSSDTSKYFVGTVVDLIPVVKNAEGNGIYSAVKLDVVDNKGSKRSIIITIDNFEANLYGEYDKMYYTVDIQDKESATIYSFINKEPSNVILTLIEATTTDFKDAVLDTAYI